MKRVDRRAQFYLIAAIVIIAIIIGFVTLKNYSQKPTTKIYDLSDELGIESDQVVEYGIVNGQTMVDLITNFTERYAEYLQGDIDNLFFIFGNFEEGIKIVTYEQITTGGIRIGGTEVTIVDDEPVVTTIEPDDIPETGIIIIEIESEGGEVIRYEFELRPGENFYYIMQKKEGDQQYIVT
jgi:hypothetical protein